jgi:hypothetical protein
MTIPVNKVRYFDKFYFKNTNEKTSGPGLFVGVHGVIFHVFSKDQAGILHIDIKVADDWRELTEETVRAGKLHVIDIDFFIPEARVRFAPKVAPTEFTAVAYGYPAVYIKEDLSTKGERNQI